MIHPHFPHYFSRHIGRETGEIYWHATLYNLALAMAYIFEPIFLYRIGYTLVEIFEFYAIVYAAYSVLIFAGAKVISRIGYKHSILLSTLFYVSYWYLLYQLIDYPWLFWIVPILFALQKSFFWPAYNAEVATHSIKQQRGREIGMLFSLIEIAAIIGPFLGGLIAWQYGFKSLFFSSGLLMVASVYPLFRSPEVYMRHDFSLGNFKKIFKRYARNFLGYFGMAEDLMLMTLWPVYIFLVIPNVFNVGVVIMVASVAAIVLMLYVGKLTDKFSKQELIQSAALFYGITWIFRFIAKTPWPVIGFDVLTRTGKGILNVPMIALTYEIAGNNRDQAIAYSVFFEFSLAIGKIVTALAAMAILVVTGDIAWVFVMTGVLTMFYGLLKK
jgi:DHA1 family multidrug resistance protein-like MFS transporter